VSLRERHRFIQLENKEANIVLGQKLKKDRRKLLSEKLNK
jgi:hypothetical protein